jgi:4-hydroxybenzoyl-CoA thioesterase
MTAFVTHHRVRFAHCDPAGIAYYPRLLEICDWAIEDWTAQVLGVPRRILHLELELALPTVDLKASFVTPVRLGETLTIATTVGDVGRSSVALATDATCDGNPRFSVRYKQVLMGMREARARAWPEEWRQGLFKAREKEIA